MCDDLLGILISPKLHCISQHHEKDNKIPIHTKECQEYESECKDFLHICIHPLFKTLHYASARGDDHNSLHLREFNL